MDNRTREEKLDRLAEIRWQMSDLIEEAEDLIGQMDTGELHIAKRTWLAHLKNSIEETTQNERTMEMAIRDLAS